VSGSSSLFLRKKTTESLAGRIYEFLLPVLSFEEYLELKKIDALLVGGYALAAVSPGEEIKPVPARESFFYQHGAQMEREFETYLKFGQFPEIVNEKNISVVRKYLIDAVYKKTIEYDIPKIFGVERVDELKFLFQMLASEAGSMVETGNIAREVGIDEKTIKKYFHYFEESFLIFLVYNFSKSIRKSKRLLKKVYLGSPNFSSAFYDWQENGENNYKMGFLAENYCAILLKKKYEFVSFYRIRKDEIDFLATNNPAHLSGRHYIEVKYRESISQKSLNFIVKNARKNGNRFTILTKNDLRIEKDGTFVPIWMLK
jgi:predicted AAA+ superfamily ATPase